MRSRPAHSGQSVSDASEKDCTASNRVRRRCRRTGRSARVLRSWHSHPRVPVYRVRISPYRRASSHRLAGRSARLTRRSWGSAGSASTSSPSSSTTTSADGRRRPAAASGRRSRRPVPAGRLAGPRPARGAAPAGPARPPRAPAAARPARAARTGPATSASGPVVARPVQRRVPAGDHRQQHLVAGRVQRLDPGGRPRLDADGQVRADRAVDPAARSSAATVIAAASRARSSGERSRRAARIRRRHSRLLGCHVRRRVGARRGRAAGACACRHVATLPAPIGSAPGPDGPGRTCGGTPRRGVAMDRRAAGSSVAAARLPGGGRDAGAVGRRAARPDPLRRGPACAGAGADLRRARAAQRRGGGRLPTAARFRPGGDRRLRRALRRPRRGDPGDAGRAAGGRRDPGRLPPSAAPAAGAGRAGDGRCAPAHPRRRRGAGRAHRRRRRQADRAARRAVRRLRPPGRGGRAAGRRRRASRRRPRRRRRSPCSPRPAGTRCWCTRVRACR